MSDFHAAKPVNGFALTKEDIPRVMAFLTIFGSYLGYGTCASSPGAALPEIALLLDVHAAAVGQIYSWRGMGFLGGALMAYTVIDRDIAGLTKHGICSITILFSGVCTFLMPLLFLGDNSNVFNMLKVLFLLQGAGFGLFTTLAIVSLQEMWGQRSVPWLQLKNLLGALGCIIGPVLVSKFGFKTAFLICAVTTLSSFFGIIGETFYYKFQDIGHIDQALMAPELVQLASSIEEIVQGSDYETRAHRLSSINETKSDTDLNINSADDQDPVLSYATPKIVEQLNDREELSHIIDVHLVPFDVRVILSVFCFLLIGLMHLFSGWIATFSILEDPSLTLSEAANRTVLFSICNCICCIYSVPASIFLSTTTMLRIQLLILLLGAEALFLPINPDYISTISAIFMGLALSCIFPLILTLANDYQMTMDSKGVFSLVLSRSVGESFLPGLMGVLLGSYGPQAFPTVVASTALIMVVSYVYVHYALLAYQKQLRKPYLEVDRVPMENAVHASELTPLTPTSTHSRGRSHSHWRKLSGADEHIVDTTSFA